MPFTEEQIREKARALCAAAGEDPDRRLQDYGRTSWSYPAWEDWRDAAREALSQEAT